jgi:hypothetical protein
MREELKHRDGGTGAGCDNKIIQNNPMQSTFRLGTLPKLKRLKDLTRVFILVMDKMFS